MLERFQSSLFKFNWDATQQLITNFKIKIDLDILRFEKQASQRRGANSIQVVQVVPARYLVSLGLLWRTWVELDLPESSIATATPSVVPLVPLTSFLLVMTLSSRTVGIPLE